MNAKFCKRRRGALVALLCAGLLIQAPQAPGRGESYWAAVSVTPAASLFDTQADIDAAVTDTLTPSPTPTATETLPPSPTPTATETLMPGETLWSAVTETPAQTALPTDTPIQTQTQTDTPPATLAPEVSPTPAPTEVPVETLAQTPAETPASTDATPQSPSPTPDATAPVCDIPDCPHVTVDENGNTVALCPLGEWMLAHPESTPTPAPTETETPMALSSLSETLAEETGPLLLGGDIVFSNFHDVVLNGARQTTTATWAIHDIVDARGTEDSWNLSLTLSHLQEWSGDAYVANGAVLDPASVLVNTMPLVTAADQSSLSDVQVAVVNPSTALDTGTPVKLLSNVSSVGVSSFTVSDMTVSLDVPACAYARTYKTDATIALSSGP